jgi:DNA end-binding protein Ku
MPRPIWKGAISFGLVHVPVALHAAASQGGIDFDWLDKRSMDPVGYKRVNKRTGKEIDKANIVKGVKLGDGEYVVIGEDEIKAAYPKTTQTIEIETFVQASEIPFTHLDSPYYLEPLAKSAKVYALLREVMLDAGVIGIARVVLHTKEHLAALVPTGPALLLNTLRWSTEVRPWSDLKLPAEGKKAADLKPMELKMARQLVADMTQPFRADQYADRFTDAVHALVKERAKAGQTEQVQALETDTERPASNVIDLADLLAKSLGQRNPGSAAAPKRAPAASRKASAGRSATRKRA